MKRNYQETIERIKVVAMAHPSIYSVGDGRELEFDIKKKHNWPRFFIRTEASPVLAGPGTVEVAVNFTFLLMDRLNVERSNVVEVMNNMHTYLTAVLATLNKDQLIRAEDNPVMAPLYDYQDTQTAGWQVPVRVYLDSGFECYEVPD